MSSALQLFEPELYHGVGPAYFGTLVKHPLESGGTKAFGKCYPVTALLDWLGSARYSKVDTYISQAEFNRARCSIATLQTIGLVWADVGDDGALASYGEAAAVNRILTATDDLGIPAPSLILASGRGYHVKWLFESAVNREELMRWDDAEKAINTALKESLFADMNATDAARVLRVAETLNTKSGNIAHLAWVNWVNGEPLRYDFETLHYEVVAPPRLEPATIADLDRITKPNKRTATGFHYTAKTLWWKRFSDMRRLCAMRGWTRQQGGVPEGYRDTVLFVCAVGLAYVAPRHRWWNEVQIMASEFCPSLSRQEWQHCMKPTYSRLIDAFTPGKKDRRYRVSNDWIIDRLGIVKSEQVGLTSVLSPDLARDRQRDADARNKAVIRNTEAKRSAKVERNEEILRLHAQGSSLRKISREIGVGIETARRVILRGSYS